MKKVSTLFLAMISIFAFSSCDNAELGPVMSTTPGLPSITSPQPGESYILTEEAAEDTLLTIEWTEPDYGFPTATNFIVEMGKTDADFAEPIKIGTTTETSYSVTVAGMNNRLLAAGYPFGQQATLEFRVVASINDSLSANVSEAIPLTFTPYEVIIVYPEIYVPGGYQAASGYTTNWEPAVAPALTSANSDGKYEGYVYFNDPNSFFKFTDERNWTDGDWGDNGADGILDPGGANIEMINAGYYKINVDLNALTYSVLNTTWGVIGDATANGWDSDQDMTYDPAAKVWTITTDLAGGKYIKFRANDAWNVEYGDDEGNGNLDFKGSNILVEETGNYTVTLNLSEYPYTYTLTKN
ncbi:MAG TPA: SusE domain-containing protein [Balneolaceae bacterium]|nr:SusE domain-containing protein [Balneolaceae bacterium]